MFKKKIKFDEYDLSENDYNLLMKTYEGNLNDFLAEKNSMIESLTIHFENERIEKELNKQKPVAQTEKALGLFLTVNLQSPTLSAVIQAQQCSQ